MFGKVFCLYLIMILLVMTMTLYAWLSGMNIKTMNIWREIILGISSLIHFGTLFHFCNYAYYFANIVRYQKTLYEDIYVYIVL